MSNALKTFSLSNENVIETNELSQRAMGGTELMAHRLQRSLPDYMDKFQVICSRYRGIQSGKLPIMWLHDMPEDPEAAFLKDPENRKHFGKLVFVSNWQMQQYQKDFGINPSECLVIKNGIERFINTTWNRHKPENLPIRIIYHSTPHRGLNILIAAFTELCNHRDDIVLDVYSSFKLYGWEEADKQFEELFNICRNHPKINYHGTQDNETVRKALAEADIFAYPSTWPETSCLCAIEAMAAGCITVVPNLGALPETCTDYAWMYQYDEDPMRHANVFVNVLGQAIESVKQVKVFEHLINQTQYYNRFYDWEQRVPEWKNLFDSLIANNPNFWSNSND